MSRGELQTRFTSIFVTTNFGAVCEDIFTHRALPYTRHRPHKSRRLPTQSAPFFRKLGHECRLRQLAQGKQACSCTRVQASVRFRTAREEYDARPTSEALGVLVIAQSSLATQGMVARLRLDLELRSARAISRLLPEGFRR